MKKTMVIALLGMMAAGGAQARVIEQACLSSDRASGNRPLCNCIQRVADATLTRRDQKTAAKFFRDPHRAQEVRQSDRQSDAVFWQRYRAFGATAENYCG
ncbi:hypothetical protein OCGS_0325 [Oceaniovalibus guishaninsula JLT2003]|uniref:Arginine transporter n=1 Tax=Oceaniovalibus guishaninsula JLT2003 TaxID=1231392 RepID=K2HE20_9RHOB|nr:hypothetical protein [Oceaniovalibus guishaninsula]EKE45708.1 hypothetical protein OCGS_0325 [Oceaniovalibus guishaninsula JLT2003]